MVATVPATNIRHCWALVTRSSVRAHALPASPPSRPPKPQHLIASAHPSGWPAFVWLPFALESVDYKQERRTQHDLCGIPVPKAAAAGPRPRDGVRGGGDGRPHRAAARQSHLVVPLAQRVAVPAATRPLHRPRSDRYGTPTNCLTVAP